MTWNILLGCLVIILARIGDVSLGTMRTVAVVNGQRGLAWLFGLFEVTIWVFAVSAVIAHIRAEPAYGIAFAVGAATGNFIGVTLLRWLPFGDQVVRVFTRKGAELCEELHRQDFRVTEFEGRGRDGPVSMLWVQVRRPRANRVVKLARTLDPHCYYTIEDIRVASTAQASITPIGAHP